MLKFTTVQYMVKPNSSMHYYASRMADWITHQYQSKRDPNIWFYSNWEIEDEDDLPLTGGLVVWDEKSFVGHY